jgi:hypothetical protein
MDLTLVQNNRTHENYKIIKPIYMNAERQAQIVRKTGAFYIKHFKKIPMADMELVLVSLIFLSSEIFYNSY